MSLYLAPLNYDRYFKKVFGDLHIAKRFLEDFLGITIQSIEFLPTKKVVTDDARYVEFDFRCKIDDHYVIVDMQQWYKPDVIQRFYLYHALNSALQLEGLPKKTIVLPENKSRLVQDYSELTPVITLIWMVHDVIGFQDDYIAYSLSPEELSGFINDVQMWRNLDIDEIISRRQDLYAKLNNPEKNLHFFKKNRLIYAFQPNIIKNKKFEKYFPWFELADKTLRKISEKFEYDKYGQDEILSEVVRRLRQVVDDPSELEYIKSYEEYIDSVRRYDTSLLKEGYNVALLKYQAQIDAAEQNAEEERRQKETAEKKAEEAQNQIKQAITSMLAQGISMEVISTAFGKKEEEINELLSE